MRLVKARAISFEAANPRHAHEWTVWRDAGLPDDVVLIPGMLDTSTNYVEHPEVVADRIERIAKVMGDPQRLLAGTDCGFETAAGSKMVIEGVVWAKLRSLAAGAAMLRDLWWTAWVTSGDER